MNFCRTTAALAILITALALAVSAVAQEVEGVLMETSGGDRIEGAFVVLIDQADRIVDTDLTKENGSFRVSTERPGTYRLRSERIGYASSLTEPFRLRQNELREMEIVATVDAVSLEPIAVAIRRERPGDDECRTNPEEVENLAIAWEEARKALVGTAWTSEQVLFRMKVYLYERLYETKTGRLIHQEARNRTGINRSSPFISKGVDHLRTRGFANFQERGAEYHGPDPEVLVSDWFRETHCFQFQPGEGEHANLLGLAFRPISNRSHPEIEGVLWLDPRESALHSLDYRYVRVPSWVGGDAQGHLEFRHLPSGEWIVDRWWIKAPDFVPGDDRTGKWSSYGVSENKPGAILKMVGGELMDDVVPVRRVSPIPESDS